MLATPISAELLECINADIAECHYLKTYRPTAVGIVRNELNRILLVRSVKGSNWAFPQGMVEEHEDVVAGLVRELGEEVGIPASVLEVQALCRTTCIDVAEFNRDDFTEGKRYFYFYVRCKGSPLIRLQAEEVNDYQWQTRRRLREFISNVPELNYLKRQHMLEALSVAP